MVRLLCCLTVVLVGNVIFPPASARAQAPAVQLVAPTEPLPAAEQKKLFRLPPGFEIELIAQEPAIRKPINLAFDGAGRLFVTQSIEYPFPAKDGTPRDTIKVIRDINGDGVPETVTTFANGLNIPIGVLPLTGGVVIGYGIPQIYRFEDTDGDGTADKRDTLYGKFGFDDTHGMASSFTWALDGWVHACHGFRNTSTVQGGDRTPITMNSGNTYRFRTDGSHIEYYTHGQVNPFGMAADALGNLYSADCHSKPIYMLLRGAFYPSFGKPHDGLGFAPEMIRHNHGSTGICGVVYYDALGFPAEYRHTVFIGNPVTGRINHDKLAAHGSSNEAIEQPDFVSCDDPWFRPVDIKLAPDGSIYVADFYNCIIGHYEVDLYHPRRDRERGRIWRISYRGNGAAPHPKGPNLATAPVNDLVGALGNENIVVRTQAVHQLVQRIGPQAAQAVRSAMSAGSGLQRAHGLWVLARLGALTGAEIQRLSTDPDRLVRTHLARAAAGLDWSLLAVDMRRLVIGLLGDADASVRRAAADALGQHPARENIEPLLGLWQAAPADDTHLVHVARISLRDSMQSIGDWPAFTAEFTDRPEAYRRLASIALGISTPAAGEFLLAYLRSSAADAMRLPEFVQHASQHLPEGSLPVLYAYVAGLREKQSELENVEIVRSVQRALQVRALALPAAMKNYALEAALRLLADPQERALRTGIDLVREFRLTEAAGALEKLGASDAPVRALRLPAIEALSAVDGRRAVPLLARLVEDGAEAVASRQKGAELLGGINSPESRTELLRLVRTVPDQVALALARGVTIGREGSAALLALAEQGQVSPRLLQDPIVGERLTGANIPELGKRLETLLRDLPTEDERFRNLLAARRRGFDRAAPVAARGLEVFDKICANCHRVAGKGGKVGPDLDGIGARGLDRLLEDILLPSRNVDQGFRMSTIALADGKVLSGLVVREEGETLIVVNEAGKEVRVPKKDIEEQRVMKLSPMPANIAEQLSEADFQSLLAWLLSLRNPPGNAGGARP